MTKIIILLTISFNLFANNINNTIPEFKKILYIVKSKETSARYINNLDKNHALYDFLNTLHLTLPTHLAILKEHFKNPHDLEKEEILDFFNSETFGKKLFLWYSGQANKRFVTAIHEAGHLMLYKEIVALEQPYSNKILQSLRAEINERDDSSGCVTVYEPNILLEEDEILLRMKVLIAGQVAQKLIMNEYVPNYLSLSVEDKSHDMHKWKLLAQFRLGLNAKSMGELLNKQEIEVKRYLKNNVDTFYQLAKSLYSNGHIDNLEINDIYLENSLL